MPGQTWRKATLCLVSLGRVSGHTTSDQRKLGFAVNRRCYNQNNGENETIVQSNNCYQALITIIVTHFTIVGAGCRLAFWETVRAASCYCLQLLVWWEFPRGLVCRFVEVIFVPRLLEHLNYPSSWQCIVFNWFRRPSLLCRRNNRGSHGIWKLANPHVDSVQQAGELGVV